MAVYTQLTNETIAEIVEDVYGLGPLVFALGIAEGVENTNYLVVAEGKDGAEHKYILTLYEKRVNTNELPFFLGLMRHLAAKGIACPQPLPRRDGTLHTEVKDRHAVLVSFLPGKSKTLFEVGDVAHVGKAIALLHRAGADFPIARENALSLAGWQALADKLEGKLDSIEPGLESLVMHELMFLDEHWPVGLPVGVIHADLFPDNVFFEDDGRLSGIIDFYFACTDMLAYDVAIALNAWCFEGDRFSAAKADALLMQYQAVRPFTAEERTAWPVLLRGAALRFLLTRAHDWVFREPGALVTPHDPREYVMKLKFHRGGA